MTLAEIRANEIPAPFVYMDEDTSRLLAPSDARGV